MTLKGLWQITARTSEVVYSKMWKIFIGCRGNVSFDHIFTTAIFGFIFWYHFFFVFEFPTSGLYFVVTSDWISRWAPNEFQTKMGFSKGYVVSASLYNPFQFVAKLITEVKTLALEGCRCLSYYLFKAFVISKISGDRCSSQVCCIIPVFFFS